MTDGERRIAEIPGGAISYREAGAGRALLLMHGIGGNARSWRNQLEGLSNRFRVIAWDAPGYGLSHERAHDLAAYVAAVGEFLDALGVDRAHVVGHSMGGVVAQGVAGLLPDRVDRLVLSSTYTGGAAPRGTPLAANWAARLDDLQRLSAEEFGEVRAASMLAVGASDTVRAEAASIASEVTYEGLLGGCNLLHRADTRGMAKAFAMPVMVITGGEDKIVQPDRSEAMAALISGVQVTRIPAVGHAAYLEDPNAYNAVLSGFLV